MINLNLKNMRLANRVRDFLCFNINSQKNKRVNCLFDPNFQVNTNPSIENINSQESDIQNTKPVNKTSFSVNRKKNIRCKNNPGMSYLKALRAISPILFSTLILGSLALSAGAVNPAYFFAGALLIAVGIATAYGVHKLGQYNAREQESNDKENTLHFQYKNQLYEKPVILFQLEKEDKLALGLKQETPSSKVQNPNSAEKLSDELWRSSGRS